MWTNLADNLLQSISTCRPHAASMRRRWCGRWVSILPFILFVCFFIHDPSSAQVDGEEIAPFLPSEEHFFVIETDPNAPPNSGDELDYSFYPGHDAFVCDDDPGTFNGTDLQVGCQSETSNTCRAFLKFDVSDEPNYINAASLHLWIYQVRNVPMVLDVKRVDNTTWTESGATAITWDKQVNYGFETIDTIALDPAVIPSPTFPYELVIDGLGPVVRDAHENAAGILSLAVMAQSEADPNFWCLFPSKDNANHKPELLIDRSSCGVAGTVNVGYRPYPPVYGASVNVSCPGCYSPETYTSLTGGYTNTVSVEDGCYGKAATSNAVKYLPGGVVELSGSASMIMKKTLDEPNSLNVLVFPPPNADYVNEYLNLAPEPESWMLPGIDYEIPVVTYLIEGASEAIEVNHFETELTYDLSKLRCSSVTPSPLFSEGFVYWNDSETATLHVEASTSGSEYVSIGSVSNPTEIFRITWEVVETPHPADTAYVIVKGAELATPMGVVTPNPHYTLYGIASTMSGGSWEHGVPVVSQWGLVVLAVMLLVVGVTVVARRRGNRIEA